MQKKKLITSILILIIASVLGVVFFNVFYYMSSSGDMELSEVLIRNIEVKNSEAAAYSYKMHLDIPKIEVSANVQHVGITKKGNMATPKSYTEVGWYKYGAMPGEKGSAVMAGHFNDGFSLPGVFYRLGDLNIGDDIYVTVEDNRKLHYVVKKIDTYDFDAYPTEVFIEDNEKLLKLITCTGEWMPEYKTHDKRLVVTAELVE